MRRRSLVLLAAAGVAAGCTSNRTADPAASPAASSTASSAAAPRKAVAANYRWFASEADLANGFCFTWVHNLIPKQVLGRLDGTELERVAWHQLVGAGDGQRGPADRYFFGVCRVDDWSLIVEDGGDLGVTDRFALPLSQGTRLVAHQRGPDGHGRFLLVDDCGVRLDFDPLVSSGPGAVHGGRATELAPLLAEVGFGPRADSSQSMAAAFALTERFTGIPMAQDLLRTRTYLLTTVPRARS